MNSTCGDTFASSTDFAIVPTKMNAVTRMDRNFMRESMIAKQLRLRFLWLLEPRTGITQMKQI